MTGSSQALSALVTGASRGIGQVIAKQLAARGVRVAVHYRENRAAAERTLAQLPGTGHALFAADLAQAEATERLWNAVSERMGGIDILVNNAGLYHDHEILTVDLAVWQTAWTHTLAANLLGPAQLTWHAVRAMDGRAIRDAKFGRGRIVNISSRGAFRGEPNSPAYAASKAGLNAMSQSLARAVGPRQIFLYALAPGWVETDMAASHIHGPQGAEILAQHPLGRVTQTDEIAAASVYCALDAPAAMTGCIIDVNGASYLRT